ncbi:ATP-binding protein [Fusobacterium perfoetens]|nr:AAA domain-containing protein [Fusobacterium perfoetens]
MKFEKENDSLTKKVLKFWEFIEKTNIGSISKEVEDKKLNIDNTKGFTVFLLNFYEKEFCKHFFEYYGYKYNMEENYISETEKRYFIKLIIENTGEIKKEKMFIPSSAVLLYNEMSTIKFEEKEVKLKNEIWNIILNYKEELVKSYKIDNNNEILEVLKKINNELKKLFNKDFQFLEEIFLDENKNDKDFNSFYLRDIEKIIKYGYNDELIKLYIEGYDKYERIEIDESKENISSVIKPEITPIGKWPSPIKYRLSLMQTVAVNTIVENMIENDNLKIMSVNGPPGTGKTTLLKDIFANIIIKRAKKMCEFANPKNAFLEKKIEIENMTYPFYKLDDRLKGYEILVASSNNGAVENISKELPELAQISRNKDKNFTEYENSFEEKYSEMMKEFENYREVSKKIIGKESWGVFSVALGKKDNFSNFFKILEDLDKIEKKSDLKKWKEIVKEFQIKEKEIKELEKEIQKIWNNREFICKNEEILKEISREEEKIERLKNKYLKINFFRKIFLKSKYKKLRLRKEIKKYELEKKKKIVDKIKSSETFKKVKLIDEKIYWDKNNYEERQKSLPWLCEELEGLRGELFILSLKIHNCFNEIAFFEIKNQLKIIELKKIKKINNNDLQVALKEAWQTIYLLFPVISTTFASLSSMYGSVNDKVIGYLVIDEAGQASPQQAIGGIWRSKHIICVGDPLQIKPVVNLDRNLIECIKNINLGKDIENKYFGENTSVQRLADLANRYGTVENGNWIGIPLWVHRRCKEPMFSIANEIAYNNKMVLAIKETGKSKWFDCGGKVEGKQYVKEQADILLDEIIKRWEQKDTNLYIITPFVEITIKLKELLTNVLPNKLENVDKKKIEKWIKNSIGTVHTFQGKEANTVYFICGGDENTQGALNWSCSEPNILNVAVTRAKKEFYIIGNYNLLSQKKYYETIANNIEKEILDKRKEIL